MSGRFSFVSMVLVVLVLISVSCGPVGIVQNAAGEHDKLVVLYNDAVTAQSTSGACIDTAIGKINLLQSIYEPYLETEVARLDAWRQNVNKQSQQFNDGWKAYQNPPTSSTGVVDLNKMVEQGATPAQLGQGFSLAIQAYAPTEAAVPVLPTDVVQTVIAEQMEAMNTVLGCVVDWNKAAQAYNTERSRINRLSDSGKIVGAAANALGLTELPTTLPLYQPKNDGGIPTFGGE